MLVPFVKMHGLGNDYIYFDCLQQPDLLPNVRALAPRLADRHFGIGGDGIVLLLPDSEADVRMRMFNADGSEAEMCGNAIRCVGKYLYDHGYVQQPRVRVQTGAGLLTLDLVVEAGVATQARVNMGHPVLRGPDIPVAVEAEPVCEQRLDVAGEALAFTAVSMGNPHAVFFVDRITDRQVLELGPAIERHEMFPNRVNAEFVQVRSREELDMRVWERGSGETLACGTGACAVAVAAALTERADRDVTVHLLGGDLRIEWAADDCVYMTGPATLAFSGSVAL